jgi:glyceraldehyde 3-phosphate dehydrogenase
MPTKIAINGFGRIGRASFKIAREKALEIIAINDLTNPRVLLNMLKYDSAYGIYPEDVYLEENGEKVRLEDAANNKGFFTETASDTYIVIGENKTKVLSEPDPTKLPWEELEIDTVLECTGRFVKDGAAKAHVDAGAKKVVISAPAKGEGNIQTFLRGVNEDQYLGQNIISNASCTTNCTSPVVSVIHNKFNVLKAALTTIHAVTINQNIIDGAPNPKKPDLRRARAGAFNIVPTTTGAAIATTNVIPDLEGKFDGIAVRVPVITGSLTDVTMLVEKKTTVEEVNNTYLKAKKNPLYKGIVDATYDQLVSSDIVGNPHSAIVDLSMTKVVDGDLVKVLAWYDNEWGYSNRLVEMAIQVNS